MKYKTLSNEVEDAVFVMNAYAFLLCTVMTC